MTTMMMRLWLRLKKEKKNEFRPFPPGPADEYIPEEVLELELILSVSLVLLCELSAL